jgi:hypothetical protein
MNNWQYGQGGPMQQDYNSTQINDGRQVRLPDGRMGTVADLVKFYGGSQQQGSQFHPTDLQEMQRQQAMGGFRG